jgi:hypothetical protein
MAITKGIDGQMQLNGVAMDVTNWTYDGAITVQETTPIGSTDQTWETTTRGGSGSLTIMFNDGDASQKVLMDNLLSSNTVAKVLMQLYTDITNTKQLYFSAVITQVSLPAGANDVHTMTVNYNKTGDMYHVPTT